MKKCIMHICFILFCILSGNTYAQKTDLIPLDENIYLHPNKNILEMRLPQDEINNLMYGGLIYPHITKIASLFKDDFDAYVPQLKRFRMFIFIKVSARQMPIKFIKTVLLPLMKSLLIHQMI